MLTIITLPTDALTATLGYVGDLFADLGPFIWLAIGIPLGFYIIKRVIALVGSKAR